MKTTTAQNTTAGKVLTFDVSFDDALNLYRCRVLETVTDKMGTRKFTVGDGFGTTEAEAKNNVKFF